MSRRALVTGASGFVGGLLLGFLKERGWETVASGDGGGEDLIPCDFSNPRDIEALLPEAGSVSHVFHLAAMTHVPEAMRHPAAVMQVNTLGVIHLIDAMTRHLPDARLVFIGSGDAYGRPVSLPVEESHPLNPVNPYAISKAAADHCCGFASQARQLDIVRMRPFNHSGPGQSDKFVLSSFARQIAAIEAGRHERVIEVGNLDSARDFLHVQDVLAAYELAALKGHAGEAYNVASGKARRIHDALDALLGMSKTQIEIHNDPDRMRPSDVPIIEGSSLKLRSHTGWIPEISFETLLEDLLLSWRAHFAGASGKAD